MLEIYRKVTAYDSLFENAEKYFGDDDGLGIPWNVRLKSQAVAESALCPSAFNPKSGAKGIAQFVLPTWKLVTGSERDEREIPEKAIPEACTPALRRCRSVACRPLGLQPGAGCSGEAAEEHPGTEGD
jgi:hypothetical protein